ncbi:melanization protease 1 [Drosophila gunungcola]|uniref:Peptidase S1 domain-containing protein n=1 Tax=Drosophila gunungcola TaxID=103775 RepID=A0A9P9YK80_9MUSC|nr:melanization protease 1 [Drosophila gunungcola]KAI8038472.1 hypothetical protein M5D96_008370 [Drosophila gunungcola]
MKHFKAAIVVAACLFLWANEGSAALLEENCGTTRPIPRRIRRVVGGRNAERSLNPWAVLVLGENDIFCSGSLITSRFVLTSASCLFASPKQVALGEYDRNCTSKECLSNRQVIDVDRQIAHPKYGYDQISKNDIALLRMAKEVEFSAYIRPICLPVGKRFGNNIRDFKAVGWGKTDSGETSMILQTATLEYLAPELCSRKFDKVIDKSQICLGSMTSDTCNGDSGGPLSALKKYNKTRRVFQFGIVSYGSAFCTGLGVYTKVEHFMGWILKTINKNINDTARQIP